MHSCKWSQIISFYFLMGNIYILKHRQVCQLEFNITFNFVQPDDTPPTNRNSNEITPNSNSYQVGWFSLNFVLSDQNKLILKLQLFIFLFDVHPSFVINISIGSYYARLLSDGYLFNSWAFVHLVSILCSSLLLARVVGRHSGG